MLSIFDTFIDSQDMISILQRWSLQYDPGQELKIKTLISQARVVVEEAVQRARAYEQWQSDRQTEKLRETNRALLTTFDVPQLTNVLKDRKPALGIQSVYLVTYEQPTDAEVPEQARLMLAYTSEYYYGLYTERAKQSEQIWRMGLS